MTKKVIDDSNLGHLVSKAKAAFWPKEDVINVNLADVATSGDYNDLSNKPTIPDVSNFITKSVNDLTNYYLKSETYTKEEVAALIGAIQQFHYEIAASTSAVTSPANNVLYLIGPTGSGTDKYEEYVYDETKPVAERWVRIGDTSIDLSGYVTTTFLSTELAKYATIASLATVATSGSYNDLSNKPTIPTDVVKYTSQSLTDAQKEQARTNIGATAPEIFWAEYGVTTFAEIEAAINANKKVLVKYIDRSGFVPIIQLFTLASLMSPLMAYFYSEDCGDGLIVGKNLDTGDTEWSELFKSGVEFNSNRVIVWQTTPDNDHYPSEKLVKDSLDAKQPIIDANNKLDYSLIANTPTIPTTYAGSPTAGGFANKTVAIPFGNVDSTSTATEITATVDNFPETLTDGVCAYVRNNVIASASGWTLNINGTGAKPVYASNSDATRTTSIFSAASTYLFVYNANRVEGGCWDLYYGYNSNDNTVGYNLRTNAMSLPMTSDCYRYRLLFTSADRTHFVPANASSSNNATAKRTTTQTPIDPFGSIRYYGSTSIISSGANPGVGVLWEQYLVTLGYSFNRKGAALTLTAHEPVYIKCTPQANGSAIIDAEEPYVQELPTTADGEIYIHLGVATSATQVEMTVYHPVYYHDGTRIVIWPGKQDALTFDTTPTENSTNPVTSGGVYNAITENEQVVAAALNDLNDRVLDVEDEKYVSLKFSDSSEEAKAFNLANKDKNFLLIQNKPVVSKCSVPNNGETMYYLFFTFDNWSATQGAQNYENNYKRAFKLVVWQMFSSGYLTYGSWNNTNGINIPIYNEDFEVPQTSFIDNYSEYDNVNYSVSCIEGSVLNTCKSIYLGNSSNFYDDSYIISASDFVDSSWSTEFPNGVKYLRVSQDYNGYQPENCWIEIVVHNNCKIVYTKYYSDPAECVQGEIDGTSSDLYLYEITDINTDAYDGYVNPIPFQKFEIYGWSSKVIIFFDANSDVPNIDFYQHPSSSYELINGEWIPRGKNNSYNVEISGYEYNTSYYPWYVHPTLKSVYDTVHPNIVTSGNLIKPNRLTQLGTLTSNTTFSLSTSFDVYISGKANHYFWTFETGATAPTITWPSGLTWPGGSPPAILPNKHYEISVLNNIVAWMEV